MDELNLQDINYGPLQQDSLNYQASPNDMIDSLSRLEAIENRGVEEKKPLTYMDVANTMQKLLPVKQASPNDVKHINLDGGERIDGKKILNGILEQAKNIAGNPYFAPAMSNLNSLFKAQRESGKNPYSQQVHDANPAQYKPIEYTPFGERQVYKPIDRNYFTNQILANAAAARSNALNITGGNKAAASQASLLHNYVGNTKLGDAISKIDEANYNKYNQVVGANNALAQANAAQKYNIDSANVTNYNNYNNTKYNRDLSNAAAQYQAEQERKAAIQEYSAGLADNSRAGKIYQTNVNLANKPGQTYTVDGLGKFTFTNSGDATTENNKEGKKETHASGGKLDLAFPYLEEWKKIRNK